MKSSIEIIGVSKKYLVNHDSRYFALRDILTNVFKKKQKKEEFWALKDISLTINAGEIVGIIGRNGAGKSTLLKILTGITPPTNGKVIMRGRVASLLEVGTGFHPELTGRENIYLNGAILGMKKKEIEDKFNEIVSFAGIEKFIDESVKHYSSGMHTRLAFAVAAHLDSDILLVDEVLAVGDWEFQKKCLGKIREISNKREKVIIFVSHDMQVVKNLCNKVIHLVSGNIKRVSDRVDEVISEYLKSDQDSTTLIVGKAKNNSPLVLDSFELIGNKNPVLFKDRDLIRLKIDFTIIREVTSLVIGYDIYYEGIFLYRSYHTDDTSDQEKSSFSLGKYSIESELPLVMLNSGDYKINFISGLHPIEWYYDPSDNNCQLSFSVSDFGISKSMFWNIKRNSVVAPIIKWEKRKCLN